MSLIKRNQHQQEIKKYKKIVNKINEKEDEYNNLSDEALRAKTDEFKRELEEGKSIHDLVPDAFATVREATRRVLGMRHYDVQLLGGLVLLNGNISEMATGEGKTLVASLPSYLVALEGKGVHIITVNEYLAQRDKELIGQIHEFLGVTVGLNMAGLSNQQKQEAYQCDITYGVGTEFGFDYLRDNTVQSLNQKVQRPYHYAIIDEVDSILIDEAKTPLIIAGKGRPSEQLYKVCATVVKGLKQDEDYTYDIEMKVVNFAEEGINKCEKIFGIDNLFDLEHSALFHSLLQALRARVLYERDVDYIVEEGEVKLIDMSTGRVMEGRSLSDGLHQAIESKEGLVNTEENKTQASITIQNYYRMYPTLSGMTGTAKSDESELQTIYGMNVIPIPSNKPNQRVDHPDRVFMTKELKFDDVVREVKERHEMGQPILIGTTSILHSEEIAEALDKENLHYQLLNAKSSEQEANLIALAGQKKQITIATNMAGRGTDIMLGEGVAELGGLHVIGTERNDNKRIDNQLKGRASRQGDPGSTQFIISLEDYLFIRYASDELERARPKFKTDSNGRIKSSNVHKFVNSAQQISEGIQYQFRDYNLKLENVIDEQRRVVYELRNKVLEEDNVLEFLTKQVDDIPLALIEDFCEGENEDDWDLQALETELNKILIPTLTFEGKTFETIEDVKIFIKPFVDEHFAKLAIYDTEDEKVQTSTRGISLFVIDSIWKRHLDRINQLKEGIGIRQYQQENPVELFEKEGYSVFKVSYDEMKYELSVRIKSVIKEILRKESERIEAAATKES